MRLLALSLLFAAPLFAEPQYTFTPPRGSADRTAIAATDDAVMVVWWETDRFSYRVFDHKGAPRGEIVSVEANRPYAAVSASHEMFLVVWSDDQRIIRAFRVGARGLRIDTTPFTITDDGAGPHVASDGFAFLVTWTRIRSSQNQTITFIPIDLVGALVPGDRTVGNEWTIEETFNIWSNHLVWTGSRYALAWSEGTLFGGNAYVTFIAPNGAPLERRINVFPIGRVGGPSGVIASVAGNGREVIIATEYNGRGLNKPSNRFALLENGTAVSGEALPEGYWYLAFAGGEYVVARAPLVPLDRPFVAIADRGTVHVVSTIRRRSTSTP